MRNSATGRTILIPNSTETSHAAALHVYGYLGMIQPIDLCYSGAKMPHRVYLAVVIAVAGSIVPCPSKVHGAVFQYRLPIATGRGESSAYLWLPPRADQIRGAIVAGMTLMEREFAGDPLIRAACAEQKLAIVFLKCGLGAVDVEQVLNDLSKLSGYQELKVVPLMFVGHSAGGPQAKACAVKMASRCFGLVQYRGGGPWGEDALPPGIPSLMMVGQFDEFGGVMRDENGREGAWEGARDGLAGFRAADERNLASMVVEPGAGHFAWSDRNAAYLALFIRKAAATMIPAKWPTDAAEPPKLASIDHKAGWLTDLNLRGASQSPAAAYDQYKGDRARANWHFDEEIASATVKYHTGLRRKDQFIRWEDPCWVDAGTRYYFTNVKWIGDGQTFEVHPVYADRYPTTRPSGGGPRWHLAGQPVGHSSAPILVKRVGGPVAATGPNTLRIAFDELAPATEGGRVTFMAYSVGDDEYRYTEQVGMLPRGFSGFRNGADQTITFAPIGDLKVDAAPVALKATSDAGLPVEFHVAWGPAVIEKGTLRVAEVPLRAAFPIEVRVVAYQFGRGAPPLVKTARPVEQTITLTRQ